MKLNDKKIMGVLKIHHKLVTKKSESNSSIIPEGILSEKINLERLNEISTNQKWKRKKKK